MFNGPLGPLNTLLTAFMDRRRFLSRMTLALFIVGLIAAMYPFWASMRPNAKAYGALPMIDVSKINDGEFLIVQRPNAFQLNNGYEYQVAIYKNMHGGVNVWDVPIKNRAVGMPDIHWWRPMYSCKNFGLTKAKDSIACLDSDTPEWWQQHWKWSLDGKNLEQMVDDLENTRGVLEGDYFVFGKRS